jgi:hypothetical protein
MDKPISTIKAVTVQRRRQDSGANSKEAPDSPTKA